LTTNGGGQKIERCSFWGAGIGCRWEVDVLRLRAARCWLWLVSGMVLACLHRLARRLTIAWHWASRGLWRLWTLAAPVRRLDGWRRTVWRLLASIFAGLRPPPGLTARLFRLSGYLLNGIGVISGWLGRRGLYLLAGMTAGLFIMAGMAPMAFWEHSPGPVGGAGLTQAFSEASGQPLSPPRLPDSLPGLTGETESPASLAGDGNVPSGPRLVTAPLP